jgi:8-oxo-dGTP pyrophosphatase MutT (NUDIX family)
MQCAAIPYRVTQAGVLEVLLVTSRGKGHWIIPKGKVKPGTSAAASAAQEAYEEAGVIGTIDQAMITSFDAGTTGWQAEGLRETMKVFGLQVEALALTWPEMFQRQRRWVPLDQAMTIVKGRRFREALGSFAAIIAPVI